MRLTKNGWMQLRKPGSIPARPAANRVHLVRSDADMKRINIVSLTLYLLGGLLFLWHVAHGYSFEHWQGGIGFLIIAFSYGISVLLDGDNA
jgi:predicted ferric reductase